LWPAPEVSAQPHPQERQPRFLPSGLEECTFHPRCVGGPTWKGCPFGGLEDGRGNPWIRVAGRLHCEGLVVQGKGLAGVHGPWRLGLGSWSWGGWGKLLAGSPSQAQGLLTQGAPVRQGRDGADTQPRSARHPAARRQPPARSCTWLTPKANAVSRAPAQRKPVSDSAAGAPSLRGSPSRSRPRSGRASARRRARRMPTTSAPPRARVRTPPRPLRPRSRALTQPCQMPSSRAGPRAGAECCLLRLLSCHAWPAAGCSPSAPTPAYPAAAAMCRWGAWRRWAGQLGFRRARGQWPNCTTRLSHTAMCTTSRKPLHPAPSHSPVIYPIRTSHPTGSLPCLARARARSPVRLYEATLRPPAPPLPRPDPRPDLLSAAPAPSWRSMLCYPSWRSMLSMLSVWRSMLSPPPAGPPTPWPPPPRGPSRRHTCDPGRPARAAAAERRTAAEPARTVGCLAGARSVLRDWPQGSW
jgi:hypothetical protein